MRGASVMGPTGRIATRAPHPSPSPPPAPPAAAVDFLAVVSPAVISLRSQTVMTRSHTDSPACGTPPIPRRLAARPLTSRRIAHPWTHPRTHPSTGGRDPGDQGGRAGRGGDGAIAAGLRKSRRRHPRKAVPALPRRGAPIGRASRDSLAPSREVATPSAKSAYSEVTSSESANGPNAPRIHPSPARPAHSRTSRSTPRIRSAKSPEQAVCSGDGDLRAPTAPRPGIPRYVARFYRLTADPSGKHQPKAPPLRTGFCRTPRARTPRRLPRYPLTAGELAPVPYQSDVPCATHGHRLAHSCTQFPGQLLPSRRRLGNLT